MKYAFLLFLTLGIITACEAYDTLDRTDEMRNQDRAAECRRRYPDSAEDTQHCINNTPGY